MAADKLSCLGQIIQTEWFLLSEVFHLICNRWHLPQIDLFATRFNKPPQFVSPVPDSLVLVMDALSMLWEDLEAYAFPPVSLLGKVVTKVKRTTHEGESFLLIQGGPTCHASGILWFHQVRFHCACQPTQSALSALQSDFTQNFDKTKYSCFPPRTSAIKRQATLR